MSSIEVKTSLNFQPYIQLRSKIAKPLGVKVGVLGNTDARRDDDNLGNAGIGLVQEFGSVTKNIPPRSALRMPLEQKSDRLMKTFERPGVKQKILNGDAKGAMQDLGFVAEEIIDDAFKSRGFGQWEPNKPATIARKKSDKPLIDTSQYRRSITSKVVEAK